MQRPESDKAALYDVSTVKDDKMPAERAETP